MNLNDLIRRRPTQTTSSAALRAALPNMEAARDAAEARFAEHDSQSGDIMLDGDAAAITAHWVALRDAREEVERLTAAVATLRQRIVVAEQAEADARLDRLRDDAKGCSDEVVRGFPALLAAIESAVKAIEVHDASMMRIAEANRVLHEAGREGVPEPHRLFWSAPDDAFQPYLRTFGADTKLAGPRGPCGTFDQWRREVARAQGHVD